MIAYLEGEVKIRGANFIVLVTKSGLGYLVNVPPRLISQKIARLFIYHYQTEKSESLYGFATFKERELFGKLIKISGLGPKGALALLSLYRPEEVLAFIQEGNLAKLEVAPGIGKKTARKVLAELSASEMFKQSGEEDLLEALESLGFSRQEAQKSLQYLSGKEKTLAEKVRRILKEKGKNA
ncbi:Holliday junction branch migration protein RuvA [bacterium]|nr:Holliday junction branch migration protein RuvA [bacterium]